MTLNVTSNTHPTRLTRLLAAILAAGAATACTIHKDLATASDSDSSTAASVGDTSAITEPTTGDTTVDDPTAATVDPGSSGDTADTTGPVDATLDTTGPADTTLDTADSLDTGVVDGDPAVIEDTCAPNDGPALDFKIGVTSIECSADFPDGPPVLHVILFQGGPLEPGTYPIDGDNGVATLSDPDGEQISETGTLSIIEWNDGFPYGEVDITFPDDTHVIRAFSAIACDTRAPCA